MDNTYLSDVSDLTAPSAKQQQDRAAERVLVALQKKDALISDLEQRLLQKEQHLASLLNERSVILQDKAAAMESLREAARSMEERDEEIERLRGEATAQSTSLASECLEAEIQRYRDMHTLAEQRRQLLFEEVGDLQTTIERVTAQAKIAEAEAQSLRERSEENDAMHRTEIERLRGDLSSERAQWKSKVEALRQELDDALGNHTKQGSLLKEKSNEKMALEREVQYLTDQLSDAQRYKEEAVAEARRLRVELSDLKEKFDSDTHTSQSMKGELGVVRNEAALLKQNLENANQRIAVMQESTGTLQASIDEVTKKYTAASDDVHELEKELNDSRRRLATLTHQNEETLETMKQCERTILNLQEEVAHRDSVLQQKEQTYRDNMKQIESRMEGYVSQFKQIDEGRREALARATEAEAMLADREGEIDLLQDEVATLKKDLERAKAAVETVESSHIQDAHRQQSAFQTVERRLEDRNRVLQDELVKVQKLYSDACDELRVTQRQNEHLSHSLEGTRENSQTLLQQRDGSTTQLNALTIEFEESKKIWRLQMDNLNAEKLALARRCEELPRVRDELAECRATVQSLRKEEKRLREQLHAMIESSRRRNQQDTDEIQSYAQLQLELTHLKEALRSKTAAVKSYQEEMAKMKQHNKEVADAKREAERQEDIVKRLESDVQRERVQRATVKEAMERVEEKKRRAEERAAELEAKLREMQSELGRHSTLTANQLRILSGHLERVVQHIVGGSKSALSALRRKVRANWSTQKNQREQTADDHANMDSFLQAATKHRTSIEEASSVSRELLGVDMSALMAGTRTPTRSAKPSHDTVSEPSEVVHEVEYYLDLLRHAILGDVAETVHGSRQVSLSQFLISLIDQRTRIAEHRS
eukprot:PhM_4_TR6539/c0_g1_i1/m.63501